MNKYVYIPKSIRESIKPLKRGYPKNVKLMVFDCETHSAKTGRAYLLTLYNGVEVKHEWIEEKDNENIPIEVKGGKLQKIKVSKVFFKFIDYLFEECTKVEDTFLLYAHNLEFDLSAVMDNIFPILFSYGSKTQPSYTITLLNGNTFYIKIYGNKLWWAKISLQVKGEKKKRKIIVIDTFNYFNSSLYRISRELKLKHTKFERPEFVERREAPSNLNEMHQLLRYCDFEIKATYDLANWILNRHKEYDVSISVSIADLASKIFRKKYMSEPLPQAPRNDVKLYAYLDAQGKEYVSQFLDLKDKKVMTQRNIFSKEQEKYIIEECQRYEVLKGVMSLAELTYHGGRASSFIGNLCEVSEVNCYDYNSFYPYAMTQLPPLTKGEWKKVDSFDNEYEGFYEVTGLVKKCKYPIILPYSERFKFVGVRKDEKISNAPLVSYEIREALRLRELKIEKIRGYVWIPNKDAINPFKDYVEYFFKMKRDESIDSSFRWYYKIQLNSLYGKCIQTNPYPEYVNQPDFKVLDKDTNNVVSLKKRVYGGGLYLPHVASWITSFCRAKLHSDLHKYNALTCSTDSFMTKQQIPLNEIGNELGQLKIDNLNGLLLFFRPKLYIYFTESISKEIQKRDSLREYLKYINFKSNQNISLTMKYALHGYRGTINDLLEMYKKKNNDYIYKHFWKTRESIIQKKPERIRVVEDRKSKLNINWENERMLCGLTPNKAKDEKDLCIYPRCFECAYGKEI
jgi:hypothetical protein